MQNTPQIALSQCIYSGGYFQKTFWTFPKNSEFWVSIFGVLVQISEGIFKFSLKNHPNLPSPSANIMKGNFKFYENRLYKTPSEIPNKWEKFLPFIKKIRSWCLWFSTRRKAKQNHGFVRGISLSEHWICAYKSAR